jgi:sugar phosphate isomerase/epimerase
VPQLAVITDELSEDLDHALAVCRELDIHAVELRSVWNTNVVNMGPDDLARLESTIRKADVTVCGIASPFLKCHLHEGNAAAGPMHSATETPRSAQWEILATSLDLADRLNAPLVRSFSFWRLADPIAARDEILDVLRDATARVASRGKQLALENEHSCNIGSGEEAAWYFDRIPDHTIGLIWDPGNEAALGSTPYPSGYDAIRDRIHHIHLKDATRIAIGTGFTTIGEGAIAYEQQFRALLADGYNHAMSLETHFSLNGSREEASRACISGIRELAARAGLPLS